MRYPTTTRHLTLLLVVTLALFTGWLATPTVDAQGGSVADLMARVNSYRAANGRTPFQQHPSLMAAAQSHAEYVATTQNYGHIGAGGSTIISRANSFGFRGYVYENFAYGMSGFASTAWAVDWWSRSAVHNANMLRAVTHFGAGVATGPESTVFVLVVGKPYQNPGWAAEDQAPNTTNTNPEAAAPPDDIAPADAAPAEPALPPAVPVVRSEPREDGSIIHVLQQGQTPWDISVVYGVPLEDLFYMNNLRRGQLVHPGEEIIVKLAAGMPTPDRTHRPHTVQEGESMWGIASRYNIPIGDLLAYNGMPWGHVIKPGDVVLLSAPTAAPTATPTATTDPAIRTATAAHTTPTATVTPITPTATPSRTPSPTPTATPIRLNTAVAQVIAAAQPTQPLSPPLRPTNDAPPIAAQASTSGDTDALLLATVGFLIVVGLGVLGLTGFVVANGRGAGQR